MKIDKNILTNQSVKDTAASYLKGLDNGSITGCFSAGLSFYKGRSI